MAHALVSCAEMASCGTSSIGILDQACTQACHRWLVNAWFAVCLRPDMAQAWGTAPTAEGTFLPLALGSPCSSSWWRDMSLPKGLWLTKGLSGFSSNILRVVPGGALEEEENLDACSARGCLMCALSCPTLHGDAGTRHVT